MARVRKLVLAIAAATSLTSGIAHALGLGEITLRSALNQPLDASIQLVQAQGLDPTEIITRMASAEEFSKAGVEREYALSDLKFKSVKLPNGQSVIQVTSSKPIREPYLNFLVEVVWPNGRQLREYTLLLDPPLYSPETVVAAAPRLPQASATPRSSSAPNIWPATARATGTPRSSTPAASTAIAGDQYRTRSNDTLSGVARRVHSAGSSNQIMLAIQDQNPDAFIDGNINRLKAGQVLRLPNESQVSARSEAEAAAQVKEQNTAWREGRSLAPASTAPQAATPRSGAAAAPAEAEANDSLRLVSADQSQAASSSEQGATGSPAALNDQLMIARESLDTSRRETEELKSRTADLQAQLDKLQRLVSLKDDQLARFQAELVTQGVDPSTLIAAGEAPGSAPISKPASADAAAQTAVVAPAPEPAPASADESADLTAAPIAVLPATTPEATAEAEPAADAIKTEIAVPVTPAPVGAASDKTEPAADAIKAEIAAPVTPASIGATSEPVEPVQIVTQTVVEQIPAEKSFITSLLGDAMVLGLGGAALLVLLLALMAHARRQKVEQDRPANPAVLKPDNDSPTSRSEEMPVELSRALWRTAQSAKVPTTDALSEADIYIAYGKLSQAAELLQSTIEEEPQRTDLRLKLMDVMGEQGDRDGFQRQQAELRDMGGVASQLDRLAAKYPAMAVAGVVAGAANNAAAKTVDLDSFDRSDDKPSAQAHDLDVNLSDAASGAGSREDDFSFDFDLDKPVAAGQPEFDESLDFAFDLDAPDTGRTQEFDLDLDLEDERSSAKAQPSPGDFEFALDHERAAGTDVRDADLDAELDLQALRKFSAVPEVDSAEGEFNFISGADEVTTKLDLARAYIDMGEVEGARDILEEVIAEGDDEQQSQAHELISKLD